MATVIKAVRLNLTTVAVFDNTDPSKALKLCTESYNLVTDIRTAAELRRFLNEVDFEGGLDKAYA